MCLSRAQVMGLKNGWLFTSDAPAREPKRRTSSLISSFLITDLHKLFQISTIQGDLLWHTHLVICVAPACSGNGTSSLRIFANVAFRF